MITKERQLSNKNCVVCGNKYVGSNSSKYCSKKCKIEGNSTYRICPVCKKTFVVFSNKSRRDLFCSRKCGGIGKTYNFLKKNKKNNCLICNKKIKGSRTKQWQLYFCSLECKNKIGPQVLVKAKCSFCNGYYNTFKYMHQGVITLKKIYCCNSCARKGGNLEKEKQGRLKTTLSFGRRVIVYRAVMEKSIGRKTNNGETIHHIDLDQNNNALKNLFLFPDRRTHSKAHQDIRLCIKHLLKIGVLKFSKGTYKITKKGKEMM